MSPIMWPNSCETVPAMSGSTTKNWPASERPFPGITFTVRADGSVDWIGLKTMSTDFFGSAVSTALNWFQVDLMKPNQVPSGAGGIGAAAAGGTKLKPTVTLIAVGVSAQEYTEVRP